MPNTTKPAFVLCTPSGLAQYEAWCLNKAEHLKATAPAEDLKTATSFWDFLAQEEVPQTQVKTGIYDEEEADFVLVGRFRDAESIFMRIATAVLAKK